MPRVGHPWRKHFYDAWFIVMEVDTYVMIILVMSWNTSTTARVWLSWFCHKIVMDVHAWQKTWPTVTNMYHHESVLFCSDVLSSDIIYVNALCLAYKSHMWIKSCDPNYLDNMYVNYVMWTCLLKTSYNYIMPSCLVSHHIFELCYAMLSSLDRHHICEIMSCYPF